jgi:hypothetical protein
MSQGIKNREQQKASLENSLFVRVLAFFSSSAMFALILASFSAEEQRRVNQRKGISFSFYACMLCISAMRFCCSEPLLAAASRAALCAAVSSCLDVLAAMSTSRCCTLRQSLSICFCSTVMSICRSGQARGAMREAPWRVENENRAKKT